MGTLPHTGFRHGLCLMRSGMDKILHTCEQIHAFCSWGGVRRPTHLCPSPPLTAGAVMASSERGGGRWPGRWCAGPPCEKNFGLKKAQKSRFCAVFEKSTILTKHLPKFHIPVAKPGKMKIFWIPRGSGPLHGLKGGLDWTGGVTPYPPPRQNHRSLTPIGPQTPPQTGDLAECGLRCQRSSDRARGTGRRGGGMRYVGYQRRAGIIV